MQQAILSATLGLSLVLAACSSGPPQGSLAAPTASTASLAVAPAAASAPAQAEPPSTRRSRLEADVARVAVERSPGSSGWRAVQALLHARLGELGLAAALETAGPAVNVVASKRGLRLPDEVVVLSAHYDHIEGCNGADDNASGVAVVLEAARALKEKPLDRTVVFAFWDLEETGLKGSAAYAERARSEGVKITQMVSLDGIGFARHEPNSQRMPAGVGTLLPEIEQQLAGNEYKANFIGAMGDPGSSQFLSLFEKAGRAAGIPAIGVPLSALTRMLLSDAARSDHASFWEAGYPAAIVSDTANFRNPNYHCFEGKDDPGTLDYAFLAAVADAVIEATEGVAAQ